MVEWPISEHEADEIILPLIYKHYSKIKVDEKEFFDLLKHSLSLNMMEKKKVIDAIPTLSQFQFDELAKVFTEEREKFKELALDHPEDIAKLVMRQQTEWLKLGDLYKAEWKKQNEAATEQKKIDDIKSSLGL